MSKKPLFHAAERVELQDLLYGTAEHPTGVLRDFVRGVFGVGVAEGFRIRVLPQTGSQIGHIELFNGRGFDWGGQWINAETGANVQRVVLGTPNTEYWLEIELKMVNTDPDQRVFWDSLVDNPDPVPDGQEIPIARALTRQTIFWRVHYPIRQNTPGLRTAGGYAPARFSDNETLVIPIAVLRTNGVKSGQIILGNPDTDTTGNDLVSVVTAAGTEQYVKAYGYGEATHLSGGNNIVIGRKFTDRRPRIFEPLLPPYQYGDTNEVLGDARSDWWMRDVKSAIDHICHQIGQMKYGAGEGAGTSGEADFGQYHWGDLLTLDSRARYVDLSDVEANPSGSGSLTAYADQFVGCTLQIVSGHWAGFYASIEGNDATDLGGNTRIYLGRHSGYPNWKELPGASTRVRIVQHRQKNWLIKPGNAATDYRGLNDLDTEVSNARGDQQAFVTRPDLQSRLDGNKAPALTVKPYDVAIPAADVPESSVAATAIAEIQAAINNVVNTRGGGEVLFRGGLHTFDAALPNQSLFQIASATGLTFRGEGKEKTILSYGISDQVSAASGVHQIFDLSNCVDVTFQDMTLQGVGTILKLSACQVVRFINCKFVSPFYTGGPGLTTPSLDLNGADQFYFDRCEFELSGAGMLCTTFEDSQFHNCVVRHGVLSTTNNSALITFGNLRRSSIFNNRISGLATTTILQANTIERCEFMHNEILGGVNNVAGAVFLVVGSSTKLHMDHNKFQQSAGALSPAGVPVVFLTHGLQDSKLIGNTFQGALIGAALNTTLLGNVQNNKIIGNQIIGPGSGVANSVGLFANGPSDNTLIGNNITEFETLLSAQLSQYMSFVGNSLWNGDVGFDLQNMVDSVMTGNRVQTAATRAYDLRGAGQLGANQLNGNYYGGALPSTAVWDLTGGSNNKGGNITAMLAAATTGVVTLPLPAVISAAGALYLNDGAANNDVFNYNHTR